MVDAGNTLHIALNCTQAESLPAVTFRYLAVCSLVNICRLIRPCFVRAGCVVIAPPSVSAANSAFWSATSGAIKALTQQYNVTYIDIDSTGVGHGVYENVKAFFLPSASSFITRTLLTPRSSRHTTLSATAIWSSIPDTPTSRSPLRPSAGLPPPAATAQPMKPDVAEKIWRGPRCTHRLTNLCWENPPIPAILWRFSDGKT